MKKILIFFILLSLLSIVYLNFHESNKSQIVFNLERTYKPLKKKNVIKLNFSGYYFKNYNDTISIYDFTNKKIKLISNVNGKVLKEIGKAGDAPTEFNHPYYFQIIKDTIYYLDVGKNSITKMDKNGKLLHFYKGDNKLNHSILINSNSFLVTRNSDKGFLEFGNLNILNKKFDKFDKVTNIFPKKKYNYWIYDGFLQTDSNYLYYITSFSNQIIKFSIDDDIVYNKNLIHKTPLLVLKEIDNMIIPSKNSNPSVLDVKINNNIIYVLSNVSDKKERYAKNKHRVIDLYDTKNGQYISSFKLENFDNEAVPYEIDVHGNKISTIYETKIVNYEY